MTPTVPTDSASIYAALNTLEYQNARLAILRPNNPPPGIAGYLMDIVDEDTVELESDITDHFIENNTAVQDQIALRPETITVRGMVAEIVLYDPKFAPADRQSVRRKLPFEQQAIQTGVNMLATRLPLIGALVPVLTSYWANRQETIRTDFLISQQQIADTNSLYGYYTQKYPRNPQEQTEQSRIFGYFYQLWKGRQYFSVETPWGFFNTMAIQTLSFNQGAATRYASEITITFKKLHFAQSVDLIPGEIDGRAVPQRSPITQNANVAAQAVTPVGYNSVLARVKPPVSP
jgi:hypothetical protein